MRAHRPDFPTRCDDVENQRQHFAVWLHGMYGAENLDLLARLMDATSLNNPSQTFADDEWRRSGME